MARANYRFDKRQRELAKQKKKEEKRLKKEARKAAGVDELGNPIGMPMPDGAPGVPGEEPEAGNDPDGSDQVPGV